MSEVASFNDVLTTIAMHRSGAVKLLFSRKNVAEWSLGRDCACDSWCSNIVQTHPGTCMCNIYEEGEFGRVYINRLHCWFCVHFELEHRVFHAYNRGSPKNSILFVADDLTSCWLVERHERAGTRSVVFVKRMTLVMLKNRLGGSLVNEFVSPVSGSECGPNYEPPFGDHFGTDVVTKT